MLLHQVQKGMINNIQHLQTNSYNRPTATAHKAFATFRRLNQHLLLFDSGKVVLQQYSKHVFAVVECPEHGVQRVNTRTREDGVQTVKYYSTQHVITLYRQTHYSHPWAVTLGWLN